MTWTKEGGEEEQDDDETVVEPITICSLIKAKTHVQDLRRYFYSCAPTTDIDFSCISRLETALINNVRHKQQSLIIA